MREPEIIAGMWVNVDPPGGKTLTYTAQVVGITDSPDKTVVLLNDAGHPWDTAGFGEPVQDVCRKSTFVEPGSRIRLASVWHITPMYSIAAVKYEND